MTYYPNYWRKSTDRVVTLTANMTPAHRLSHNYHSSNLQTFKWDWVGDFTYDYQVPQKCTSCLILRSIIKMLYTKFKSKFHRLPEKRIIVPKTKWHKPQMCLGSAASILNMLDILKNNDLKSSGYYYVSRDLAIRNSAFYPHSVFMSFVRLSE